MLRAATSDGTQSHAPGPCREFHLGGTGREDGRDPGSQGPSAPLNAVLSPVEILNKFTFEPIFGSEV